MKFDNINIFDLAKTALIVAVIVFMFVEIPKIFNKPSKGNGVDVTEIHNIAANAAVATVAENNKELKTLITQLQEQNSLLIKQINQNKERVDEVGNIAATLTGKVDWMSKADTYKDPENPKRDLEEVLVKLDATNGTQYPVATVRLSPNLKGEERWSVEPHDLTLYTNIVETTDNDGNPKRYAEGWVENHWSSMGKNSAGDYIHFPVDLKINNWAIREPKDKKFWFNPRLGLTGMLGQDYGVGLHINLFSYGATKADSDWLFASFGIGKTNDVSYLFATPVSYNIGKPLPLLENLFVGPLVYYDNNAEYGFGFGLSTSF